MKTIQINMAYDWKLWLDYNWKHTPDRTIRRMVITDDEFWILEEATRDKVAEILGKLLQDPNYLMKRW
jgi:hypothetical protein